MALKVDHSVSQATIPSKPLSSSPNTPSTGKADSASSIRYCSGPPSVLEETNAKDASKEKRSCFQSLKNCVKAIRSFFISLLKGILCCHFCQREKKLTEAEKKENHRAGMWSRLPEQTLGQLTTWFSSQTELAKELADMELEDKSKKGEKPSCGTPLVNAREHLELVYFREEGRKDLYFVEPYISPRLYSHFTQLLSGTDKSNVEDVKKFKSQFSDLIKMRQEQIKSKEKLSLEDTSIIKN